MTKELPRSTYAKLSPSHSAQATPKTGAKSRTLSLLEETEGRIETLEAENRALRRANRLIILDLSEMKSKYETEEFAAQDLKLRNLKLQHRIIELQKISDQGYGQIAEPLKIYSKILKQSRMELIDGWKQLSEQIEVSKSTHPLSDLLKFTEKEIINLQEQILKLPSISQQRPLLEKRARKLVEQKTYLKNLIDASVQELKDQAQTIREKITRIESAITIPPPPEK